MSMRLVALIAAFVLTTVASSEAQAPAALVEITVTSVGPGAPEWPIYIGVEKGIFAKYGLKVSESIAGNVQNCVNALVTGDAPIAVLASDIVVVANARKLPIKYIAPLVVAPTYVLVVGPSIKTWNDLKNQVVLVTNKEDITAIMLRKMAAAQHIDWLKDFNILLSGTSQLRTAALISGNAQGAMLTQPYDTYAVRQGMHVLGRASDVLKEWLSNGIAVNPNWAATHRSELVRFLRAHNEATKYAYEHPAEAIAVMAQKLKIDPAEVQISYNELFVNRAAISRSGIVDEKALLNVIAGVVEMGTLPGPTALADLLDSSFAREAAGLR